MDPTAYGAATDAPSFLFIPSEHWLAVAWPLALALVVAAIEGWCD